MQLRFFIWSIGISLLFPIMQIAFVSVNGTTDEICDNAKDDDGDGRIDLNDPDCDCQEIKPVSVIPNPSFEEISCCPQNNSELNCATGWIQASEATTDFLHTCGWIGVPGLPPPLPFPDGDACVGLRNGSSFVNWKEYIGTCLTVPMRTNVAYRLRFHVGFTQARNSPRMNLVLFGTSECNNLPFGIGIPDFGCPTNAAGWQQLGMVSIEGDKEWKIREINFTASQPIYAIALGPDCNPGVLNPEAYYFLDNLILDELADFEFVITATNTPCTEAFTLQVPAFDSLQFQWYKDGIALVNEIKPLLQVKQGKGNYIVRITSDMECKITLPYKVNTPVIIKNLNEMICKGQTYSFGKRMLNATGVYRDTFKTAFNCDSIVELSLRVSDEVADTISKRIFKGEYYQVGINQFNKPGKYDISLQSTIGCDSLIHLDLQFYQVFIPNVFSPNGDGNNDVFTVFGGKDLVRINQLQIFDRWGNLVFQKKDFLPNDLVNNWNGQYNGKPASNDVYIYTTQLLMDNGVARQFTGSVMLIR